MPKLSVCIPVEPGHGLPTYIVRELLKNDAADLEIILSTFGNRLQDASDITEIAERDTRLRLLPPAPDNISAGQLWVGTVAAAQGDWVTLIYPEDMIEPDLPALLTHLEEEQPKADALGWSAFQISPSTPRYVPTNVAVPVLHNVTAYDKAPMLEAFFYWKGSQQTPRMPFGLFHGAIKRSLVETILGSCGELSWLTLLPQYEWSARVLIFADALALSNRPLSACSVEPFKPQYVPSAIQNFPLHSGIGITAAIAEIQVRTLAELGSEWAGFGEDFVTACLYDCASEHNPSAFQAKVEAYRKAFLAMPGGAAFVAGFQPPYSATPPSDARRGLFGKVLLVDRFIGNAVTAQEFYAVMRAMLTPIEVIASGGAVVDLNKKTK
ncbi:hypothetical protein [Rhizobium oryziradicis]|uniref:Glycosyltransferase 2-like domain-containing protein n=1 Tax=Rhizobium oryziradicis TaxID=1867956 RepID=A0A1Q8ZSL3_9HYPH|nr:hypothetical protein [Rhizobium oryziradicis]OLP45053.1 hypothetical protein BJF95_16985 [Rhizobium oryziradicis]